MWLVVPQSIDTDALGTFTSDDIASDPADTTKDQERFLRDHGATKLFFIFTRGFCQGM
jgi:hypothetical protein